MEACDDGNATAGDGCSSNCSVEAGWECVGQPSVCVELCGNTVRDTGEQCDGADLGGQTCDSLGQGYVGGTLSCTASCTYDTSSCTADLCATVSLSLDLESGAAGFTHNPTSGIAGDDPWELGTPSGHGGVGCHSGGNCWATDLDSDYDDCEMAELVSPIIDLSDCASSSVTVELTFWHWYNFEDYSSSRWWDGWTLQLSPDSGASWFDVSPTPGYQGLIDGSYGGCTPDPDVGGHQAWSGNVPGGAWTQVSLTVAAQFKTPGFRFRFLFGADENTIDWGWLIDDVALSTF